MKQGDFPLYTKKKLDEIWKRWSKKKEEQKQSRQQEAKTIKPGPQKNYPPKGEKKASAPLTDDMLEQLKLKFGK
ncbi:hypothetical protein D9M68_718940 [compost metagenome]